MAEVTVYDAARMKAIEDNTVVNGSINANNHLILTRHDGTTIDAGSLGNLPPGVLTAFPLVTPPAGWLMCDGSNKNRVTYAGLFAILGTVYGVGDGSTTFGLPDLRGRIPVGLDNLGGTDAGRLSVPNTLGGTGGEEKHALTLAELAAHTHAEGTLSAQGSTVGGANNTTGRASMYQNQNTTSYNIAIQGATASTGSGTPHNVMQPYILMNWIIKT